MGSNMSAATLLLVTAVIEALTGVALLALPASALAALFGETPDSAFSLLLARLFGAPLVSLGFAYWAASHALGRRAVALSVTAMLFYNVVVTALLAYAGTILGLVGIALLPAVILHLLLAVWCVSVFVQGGKHAANAGMQSR
jgi:hypothetical protein